MPCFDTKYFLLTLQHKPNHTLKMNTISVQQPWGTIICCGLKDVENRTWALKSTPMRLLIHVGARSQGYTDETLPLCDYRYVQNYQIMGILPTVADFPKSAIIGVATVEKCVTDSPSRWAMPESVHWVIKDAKMFKEPIMRVKGKLGIFDYPGISEDNLPECVDIPRITRDGTHITMPLAAELLEALVGAEDKTFFLNLTDDIWDTFLENNMLRKIESFTFLVDGKKIDAKVANSYIMCRADEEGNELTYEEYDGTEEDQLCVVFTLKF